MKKMLWVCIVVSMMLLLCACSGKTQGLDKTEDSGSSNKVHPIVGAWYVDTSSDELELLLSFCKSGEFEFFYILDGVIHERVTGTYAVDDNTVRSIFSTGSVSEPATFSVLGNKLTLNDSGDVLVGERINKTVDKLSNINGTCDKIGLGVIRNFWFYGDSSYPRQFSFYQDGTYVAENCWYDPYDGVEKDGGEKNGKYEIIHDGRTILLNSSYYFDYSLLENGLLVLSESSGESYVYVYQGW